MRQNDKYVTGDFLGWGFQQMLFTNSDWASARVQYYYTTPSADWYSQWYNGQNGLVGDWVITGSSRYVSGKFEGTYSELLATDPTSGFGPAKLMYLAYNNNTGSLTWFTAWSNGSIGYIGSWRMKPGDSLLVGNLNSGTAYEELLCINKTEHTAALMRYDGTGWAQLWSNNGVNTIGPWTMGLDDQYRVGDFDGDGNDELLCIASNSAKILKFDGWLWNSVWSSTSLGPWTINATSDIYRTGNIDSDSKIELLAMNPGNGNASTLKLNGTTMTQIWSNGGTGNIGGCAISANYRYFLNRFVSGQFDQLTCLLNSFPYSASLQRYYLPPVITYVTPSPASIYWGQSSVVTCLASDPNGDQLSYSWSNTGNGVGYTVSSNAERYTVSNVSVNPQTNLPVRVNVSNAHGGTTTGTATVTMYAANPPGGGGGCPYVSTWKENGFHEENNILPQSEYAGNEGNDVVDRYQLQQSPQLRDGRYVLKISEFEHEISNLDQLQLIAVDHSAATKIALLQDASIVEFVTPYQLTENNDDEVKKLNRQDGSVMTPGPGQKYTLNFQTTDPGDPSASGGLIMSGWTRHGRGIFQKCCIDELTIANGQQASNVARIFGEFRERRSSVYLPVAKISPQMTIQFGKDELAIDYANIAVKVQPNYIQNKLELVSAKHSKAGDVTTRLSTDDKEYAVLSKGEEIELQYSAPSIPDGVKRDFILVSLGRYVHIAEPAAMPQSFELNQNYPNPFNPTTRFDYALPSDEHVSLKVYSTL
ncbi:MAG TPA: hypothetical protein VL633_11560, partial [Bacteroidota bacterium]|nr:hypothetical protein [Bacteroidota bacterium]